MKINLKTCDICGNMRPIWKNLKNKKYCKNCATRLSGNTNKRSPVSQKQKVLNREYSQLRTAFLALPENTTCRAKMQGCTGLYPETMTIHHSRGRGEYMLDQLSWIPLCMSCHRWVEENPREAKKMGLSYSRLETTNYTK